MIVKYINLLWIIGATLITNYMLHPVNNTISDFEKKDILGNVRDTTIKEVWHGKKMQRLRNLHKEKMSYQDNICRKCHHASVKEKREVTIRGKTVTMMFHKYKTPFKGFGM